MTEYIEREAAIEKTECFCDVFVTHWTDEKVLAWIRNLPTAKVIEAPCDIGDVFWRVDTVNKRVERVKVSGLTKKVNGTWKIRITCHYGVYEIVPSEIGKCVFRTEEEAEGALNEGVH